MKKEEPRDVKKEKFNNSYIDQFDRTFVTACATISALDVSQAEDDLYQRYLKIFNSTQQQNLDSSYGVHKLQAKRLMIGDSSISIDNKSIKIGYKQYYQSRGLLELLFKKVPNENLVSANDIQNYRKIVNSTNAHRKYYSGDNVIRDDKSAKFLNIIAPIVDSPYRQRRQSQLSGKGSSHDAASHDCAEKKENKLYLLGRSE